MEPNEEITIQLWDYIDGNCNDAEATRIAALIEKDAAWQQTYMQLSGLNASIVDSLSLEQPSMRFTKNVMEAVATTQIAPATKKYINTNIIRSIAAFFIITITFMIGYAMVNADWSTPAIVPVNTPHIDVSGIFNTSFFNTMMAINTVLALVLLDFLLKRKQKTQA